MLKVAEFIEDHRGNPLPIEIQSAESEFNTSVSEAEQFESIKKLVSLHVARGDPKRAEELAELILAHPFAKDCSEYFAECQSTAAIAFLRTGKVVRAIKLLISAQKHLELIHIERPGELARVYLRLGIAQTMIHNLSEAIEHYRRALSLAQKLHDKRLIVAVLNNLAKVEAGLERFDNAHHLLEEGWEIASGIPDIKPKLLILQTQASTYSGVAELALDENDHDSCSSAVQKGLHTVSTGLQLIEQEQGEHERVNFLSVLGYLRALGNDADGAIEVLQRCMKMRVDLNDPYLWHVAAYLAFAYARLGETSLAHVYLEQARQEVERHFSDLDENRRQYFQCARRVHSALGEYQLALGAYQKEHYLSRIAGIDNSMAAAEVLKMERRLAMRDAEIIDFEKRTRWAESIVRGLPVSVVLVDSSLSPVFADAGAQQLFFEPGSGKPRIWFSQILSKAFASEAYVPGENKTLEVTSDSGRTFLMALQKCRVDSGGYLLDDAHTSIAIMDITNLRQSESQIKQTIEYLSHDLRTPLASIIALCGNGIAHKESEVRLGGHTEAISKLAADAIESLEQLIYLTQASTLKPDQFAGFSATDLVFSAANLCMPIADAAGVELSVNVPEFFVSANGDLGLLRRALINLIDNAIRYARLGGCRVAVNLMDEAQSYVLEVTDDGPGFSEHLGDKNQIQQNFGFGLKIASTVAEKHGGTMHIARKLLSYEITSISLCLPKNPHWPGTLHSAV